MAKKKFNFWYLLIIIILIFIVIAAYKNLNNHHEKEYRVLNSRILETARECYLKKDCEGEIILKDLYEKKYLNLQIDPKTKENMNENICIKFDGKEAIFCE